jgi:hypothetical protein
MCAKAVTAASISVAAARVKATKTSESRFPTQTPFCADLLRPALTRDAARRSTTLP